MRLLLVGLHMVSVDLEQAASPIIVLLVRLAHLLQRLILVLATKTTANSNILSLGQHLLVVR